jgi:hypothetical protein
MKTGEFYVRCVRLESSHIIEEALFFLQTTYRFKEQRKSNLTKETTKKYIYKEAYK